MLWVYGRKRVNSHRGVPDEIARQRDFYAIPNAPAGESIESFLARTIENPGLSAVRHLLAAQRAPIFEQRLAIARYIAFQEWRVPYSRETHRSLTAKFIQQLLDRFDRTRERSVLAQQWAGREGLYAGPPTLITREEVEAYAKNISANPTSYDLESMINLATRATDWYLRMDWTILLAPPKTSFITSDNPVFKYFRGSGGDETVVRPDCHICCPLAANALLVMKNPPNLR